MRLIEADLGEKRVVSKRGFEKSFDIVNDGDGCNCDWGFLAAPGAPGGTAPGAVGGGTKF